MSDDNTNDDELANRTILNSVMKGLADEEVDSLDNYEISEEEVSDSFHALMGKEFKRLDRCYKRYIIGKRIAGFAAIFSVVLLVAINSGAVFAGCMDFIKSLFDGGFTQYEDVDNNIAIAEPEGEVIGFKMNYIPDGFEMYDDGRSNFNSSYEGYYYCRRSECRIIFRYSKSKEVEYWLDNEYTKQNVYNLKDGIKADYYVSNYNSDESMLIWKYGRYTCHIYIDNYDKDWEDKELIKFANGIEPILQYEKWLTGELLWKELEYY